MIQQHTEKYPLYECLALLIDFYQKATTPEVVLSGLPLVNEHVSLKVFVQAARRAGIRAEIKKVPLTKLLRERLPAIILLNDNIAIFATEYHPQQQDVRFLDGQHKGVVNTIAVSQLSAAYLGYAILVKPIEEVGLEKSHLTEDKSKHWFRRTLFRSWRIYRDVLVYDQCVCPGESIVYHECL